LAISPSAKLVHSIEDLGKSRTLVLFYSHRAHLNEGVLVMVVCPMAFVTVPIALMVAVPIFVIPIVVPSILVGLNW